MSDLRRSLLAALLLVAGALTACEESGARPTTTIQAPDSADQVLEGFSHYVTNEGIRRSRVQADTAYFYEATQITNLVNVRVTFYDLKGGESSTGGGSPPSASATTTPPTRSPPTGASPSTAGTSTWRATASAPIPTSGTW
jgi:hypothetical protein